MGEHVVFPTISDLILTCSQGPHDSNFHNLWETLRDEYEALVRKGYTGEGFLSAGQTLGGSGGRAPPPAQIRELARINAEKRRAQGALFSGSGQKLGGTPTHLLGRDIRKVMADQATRRKTISSGCASGTQDAIKLSQQAESGAFSTKAEEDDANNLAISKALQELMEEDEDPKLVSRPFEGPSNGGGLGWTAKTGLYDAGPGQTGSSSRHGHPSEEEQMRWAMEDSTRCAEDSSLGVEVQRQAPLGQHSGPYDYSSRTMTPEHSDRTVSHEVPDRAASSAVAEGNASETDHATDVLPSDGHAHDALGKRKRHASRSSSIPTLAQSLKQERIIEEDIELPGKNLPSDAGASAGDDWACQVCTCINPLQFLACDACGIERPQAVLLKSRPTKRKPVPTRVEPASSRNRITTVPVRNESLGWNCGCGAFMEHKWWTCSACGTLKPSS